MYKGISISRERKYLKTEVLVAFLSDVDKKVAVEEVTRDEVLDAELFQPNSDQPGVMLVEDRLDGRDLSRTYKDAAGMCTIEPTYKHL